MLNWLKETTKPLRKPFPWLSSPLTSSLGMLLPYPMDQTPRNVVMQRVLRLGKRMSARERQPRIEETLARIAAIEADVRAHEPAEKAGAPVVLFNATSGPGDISFTYLTMLLTSWSLRLAGERVIAPVCQAGMLRCPQGTYWYDPSAPPPCEACVAIREQIVQPPQRDFFPLARDVRQRLPADLKQRTVEELTALTYDGYPVGEIVLPTLRHTLRRHNLVSDPITVGIFADYIVSAVNVIDSFTALVEREQPKVALFFNGFTFPEASARAVAQRHGVEAITYEFGFRNYSAFFSHGRAPEYLIDIPGSFEMTAERSARLDAYLEQRFSGNFTMGGQFFWRDIQSFGPLLREKIETHRHVVPVFTNTVFDTSQATANVVFEDMFQWLDATLNEADANPDTLFIVRAHPDEFWEGPRRSRERVGDWLATTDHLSKPNVVFIGPEEYISSYDLIGVAKFCLVYNSTVGLEAAITGKPILLGGKSKYSHPEFARTPATRDEYMTRLREYLAADEIDVPGHWQSEARRYFYYLLFMASLDMSGFVEPLQPDKPVATLRRLTAAELAPANNLELGIIVEGIVSEGDFRYNSAPGGERFEQSAAPWAGDTLEPIEDPA